MSAATDILRARANEALAELLDVLDRISLLTVVDEGDEDISIELLDARNRLERVIAGEADRG